MEPIVRNQNQEANAKQLEEKTEEVQVQNQDLATNVKLLDNEKDKVLDKNSKQLKDEKEDFQQKTGRQRKIINCLRKNTANAGRLHNRVTYLL